MAPFPFVPGRSSKPLAQDCQALNLFTHQITLESSFKI